MGLSGSGKSYYSDKLRDALREKTNNYRKVRWYSGEVVRRNHDDWDFTEEGRIRQSERMFDFSERSEDTDYVICEMIAPLLEMRQIFQADWLIWVDTNKSSNYPDTDQMFVPPDDYDFRITERKNLDLINQIADAILTNTRP